MPTQPPTTDRELAEKIYDSPEWGIHSSPADGYNALEKIISEHLAHERAAKDAEIAELQRQVHVLAVSLSQDKEPELLSEIEQLKAECAVKDELLRHLYKKYPQFDGQHSLTTEEHGLQNWFDEALATNPGEKLVERIKNLEQLNIDACEDDTAIRNIARKHFTSMQVDGDKFGVPTIVDVVELMDKELAELRRDKERLEYLFHRDELHIGIIKVNPDESEDWVSSREELDAAMRKDSDEKES